MGGLSVVLIIVGLLFSVVWLIFPFVVSAALSRIERRLIRANETLDKIADRANETNRALQFLVDKDKRK